MDTIYNRPLFRQMGGMAMPSPQEQMAMQQPMPMPAQAGGYINPNTGELLEAEQGPHIDKMAKKGKK